MVNAGRILIMPRGVWSNLEAYEMLDLVTQDSVAYLARKASVGVSPKTDSTLEYWQPFGSAVEVDGSTIIVDANNKIAVNIDGETIQYDSVDELLKVAIDNNTLKYDSVNGYLYASLGTVLTGTLAAGSTTITFTDASIGNNSLIDVYTDTYGVNPKTMTQSGTSIVLTFKEQAAAVVVKLVVKN